MTPRPDPAAAGDAAAAADASAAAEIVMVPGLGLGERACAPTLRHLRTPARVVRLPGYGRPAEASTDLSPPALAGLLLAGLPRPVVLVGHSASCQIVAEAAAQAPERVVGLVLVGPTTDPRSRGWAGLVARWLRTACWERPTQVPVLVQEYRRTGLRSMRRGMESARHHRVVEALARTAGPVLVLRGRHDRIAPQDWCARVAAGAEGRAVTLDAGGHMVPLTHGREVAAHVDGWFATR